MCVWVVARLPQRLKSTFFEKISSLQVPFGDPRLEKISKNVDFSLCGKHCIVLLMPKWTFFRVLDQCDILPLVLASILLCLDNRQNIIMLLPLVLDSILLLLDKARLTDSMRLEGWALCLAGVSETSVGYSGRPRYCWVKALKSWYKFANRLVRVRNSSFLNWAAPRRAAISAFISLSNRNSLNSGPENVNKKY